MKAKTIVLKKKNIDNGEAKIIKMKTKILKKKINDNKTNVKKIVNKTIIYGKIVVIKLKIICINKLRKVSIIIIRLTIITMVIKYV